MGKVPETIERGRPFELGDFLWHPTTGELTIQSEIGPLHVRGNPGMVSLVWSSSLLLFPKSRTQMGWEWSLGNLCTIQALDFGEIFLRRYSPSLYLGDSRCIDLTTGKKLTLNSLSRQCRITDVRLHLSERCD